MAEINIHNYEAFFLDYHERNLTAEQEAALLLFVEQHPELKALLDEFEAIAITDYESVEYLDKGALKKRITAINKNDFYIAKVENTLNPVEENLLDDFLKQNPAQQKELALFYKTKLQPDTTIVFEKKSALKRKAGVVITMYYAIAVAASIMLLIGLFFLNKDEKTDTIAVLPVTEIQQPEKTTITEISNNEPETRNNEPIVTIPKQEKNNEPKIVNNKQSRQSTSTANITELTTTEEPLITFVAQPNNIAIDTIQQMLPPVVTQFETPVVENKEIANNPVNNKANETPIVTPTAPNVDYTSLRELAAEKIKEKLLDKTSFEEQQRGGRSKKINAWDIAQMLTKGVSKISGRDMELKPSYDDNGNVTSYAFDAGNLHISRGQ